MGERGERESCPPGVLGRGSVPTFPNSSRTWPPGGAVAPLAGYVGKGAAVGLRSRAWGGGHPCLLRRPPRPHSFEKAFAQDTKREERREEPRESPPPAPRHPGFPLPPAAGGGGSGREREGPRWGHPWSAWRWSPARLPPSPPEGEAPCGGPTAPLFCRGPQGAPRWIRAPDLQGSAAAASAWRAAAWGEKRRWRPSPGIWGPQVTSCPVLPAQGPPPAPWKPSRGKEDWTWTLPPRNCLWPESPKRPQPCSRPAQPLEGRAEGPLSPQAGGAAVPVS